ncbi:33788_t:CDS:2, partial [Racocetra persica]
LQDSIKMTIYNGEEVFVKGGLEVVTANLPQGDDLCGVKQHRANHMQFSEIQFQKNLTNQMRVAKRKVKRLIEYILALFNEEKTNAFVKIEKLLKLPKFWSKLPNPITHQKSFMMSDLFHFAMLIPHILSHFLRIQQIKDVNMACSIKESMHRLFKNFVPYTNKKNIDLDLLKHYNMLQALHFWLDESPDIINDTKDEVNSNFNQLDAIYCNDNHFIKIRTRKPWNLYKAYCKKFGMLATLNMYKVSFFEHISYIVVKDNNEFLTEDNKANCYIKVRVGDVVELKEISDSDSIIFALVK